MKRAKTITRGTPQDLAAYKFATRHQGYNEEWEAWLNMPLSERQDYQDGAAGLYGSLKVLSDTDTVTK